MATGKAACIAAAKHAAEAKRKALMAEKRQKTAEVTAAWNAGFAALKADNDAKQQELKEWWNLQMMEIVDFEDSAISDCLARY